MAYAVKILNCDANCKSCYETRLRENDLPEYDINKIVSTLKKGMSANKDWNSPTIHGGEPLLIELDDMELLLQTIFDVYKRTGIQTNLKALTEDHIELFKQFKTHVGVSLDGMTKETNAGRGYDPGPIIENLKLLKESGIATSLIVVIRNPNAGPEKAIKFLKYVNSECGVNYVKTNPGIDFYDLGVGLTDINLTAYFKAMADFALSQTDIMIQPYRSIIDILIGVGRECIYTKCDPFHTIAEVPIKHDGTLGNCLKNHGATDGIFHLRSDSEIDARYEALAQIPQRAGGCKGCRFWTVCFAGCPGAGTDNDWRNRTRFCKSLFALYEYIENKLKSLIPNLVTLPDLGDDGRGNLMRHTDGSTWTLQDKPSIKKIKDERKKCDKGRSKRPGYNDWHGDKEHGDHTDDGRRK